MENILPADNSLFFNFFDIDKTVSGTQYLDFLMVSCENIVKKRFPNDRIKQRVRKYKDRISLSCPICGDSMQKSWNQRGNIILEGKHRNHFKCFNCGAYKNVSNFLKDFEKDIPLEIINYISSTSTNFSDSFVKYDISLLLDIERIESYALEREEIKSKWGLVEIKDSPVEKWLNNRLQFKHKKFLYNPLKNYLLILNLAPSEKIIGFQKRNFEKGLSKYLTFGLPKIYEGLQKTEKVPDDIDSISQLFDICAVDFGKPITLFEGPLDSMLFRNSVANGGANKGFPIDLPLRFFYDGDKTGRKKSLEQINNGNSVFLWEKIKSEYGLPHREKWDLTDLLLYFKINNVKVPYLENYFSNDPLDSIDI